MTNKTYTKIEIYSLNTQEQITLTHENKNVQTLNLVYSALKFGLKRIKTDVSNSIDCSMHFKSSVDVKELISNYNNIVLNVKNPFMLWS